MIRITEIGTNKNEKQNLLACIKKETYMMVKQCKKE